MKRLVERAEFQISCMNIFKATNVFKSLQLKFKNDKGAYDVSWNILLYVYVCMQQFLRNTGNPDNYLLLVETTCTSAGSVKRERLGLRLPLRPALQKTRAWVQWSVIITVSGDSRICKMENRTSLEAMTPVSTSAIAPSTWLAASEKSPSKQPTDSNTNDALAAACMKQET